MEFIKRVRVIYFEIMFRELNVTKDAGHVWNLFSPVAEMKHVVRRLISWKNNNHSTNQPIYTKFEY